VPGALASAAPPLREPLGRSLWMDCNIAASLRRRLAGRMAKAAPPAFIGTVFALSIRGK